MALRTVVEHLDDVPEALKAEYKDVNGRFVLDLEGVEAHPEVMSLKIAFDKMKGDRRKAHEENTALKERLATVPEDFDPDEYDRLKATGKPGEIDERLAKQKQELDKKYATDLAKLEKKAGKYEASLRRVTIDDGLTRALLDAGVSKELMAAAKALLKEKGATKLVEEDDSFRPYADDGISDRIPLNEYVGKWVASDEGKVFVSKATGSDATGGNGRSSSGPNPWAKGQENLTKQQLLIRDHPDQANRLARSAGVNPDW